MFLVWPLFPQLAFATSWVMSAWKSTDVVGICPRMEMLVSTELFNSVGLKYKGNALGQHSERRGHIPHLLTTTGLTHCKATTEWKSPNMMLTNKIRD